jgi:WD40 repeat protein
LILTNPVGGVELGTLSTAELTIHDSPGTLRFSTTSYTVNESGAIATITVNRVGGAEGTVTVKYATGNKTAIAPGDYTAETGTLTFDDGETSQSFDIQIVGDSVFEPNETLTLALLTPTGGARLGVPRIATLTIVNDDDLMSPGTIVVGAGNSGVVKLLDGKSGIAKATIQAFPVGFKAGVRVATGDVNGDGTADIIAAPGANGSMAVRVFNGTNGTILSQFDHGLPLAGGVHVAAGDLDGDDNAEIIVGAGAGASPHVKVFDGATRTELRDFEPFPGTTHGVTLAVGDVSGDTSSEIIIGAGAGGPGTVKIYDWQTSAIVNTINAFTGLTGGVTVTTRAVAGNKDEIIVAAGAGGGPHVKVFNGATGAEIPTLLPPIYAATFRGGVTIAVGDVDGDGILELVTGSGPGASQKVKIFHVATGQVLKQYSPYGALATNGTFVAVAK